MTERRILLLLSLGFLLIRVVLLQQHQESNPFSTYPIIDSDMYLQWAESILQGKRFFQQEYHHAPGYAVFLAAVLAISGHNLYAIVALQSLLLALQGWMVFYLSKRLFGSAPAWLSFVLYSLCGPILFYSMKILSETLYITLLLTSFFFLIRHSQELKLRDLFFAGLFLGAAIEVRGNAMLAVVPSLAAAIPAARGNLQARAKAAMVLILGVIVLTLPVLIRNVRVAGAWTPVAANWGENFYFGNNPNANGGMPYVKGVGTNILAQITDIQKEASKRSGRKLSSIEAQRYWSSQAFEFIFHQPVKWLSLEWIKLRRTLQSRLPSDTYFYDLETEHYRPHLRAFIGYGWFFPLFFLGLLTIPANSARIFLVYFAFQASFLLTFWPTERYLLPIVPYLLMTAGCITLMRKNSKPSPARIAVAVIGFTLCLYANLRPIPVGGTEAWYANASSAHFANQEFENAAVMAKQALKINRRYAEGWINLGAALYRLDRKSDARNAWLHALEIDSSNLQALRNLALSYENEDRSVSLFWWDKTLKAAIAREASSETITAIKDRIGQLES